MKYDVTSKQSFLTVDFNNSNPKVPAQQSKCLTFIHMEFIHTEIVTVLHRFNNDN